MTRSAILLEVDRKRITLRGEAFLPGYGSPDFVIQGASLSMWDSPEDRNVSPDERKVILETLTSDFKAKGLVFEIEE